MKKIFILHLLLFLFVLSSQDALGQCIGGTRYPNTVFTPTNNWQTATTTAYAGQYARYNVVNGVTYEWSTCSSDGGNASYDSYLTVQTNAGAPVALAWADNTCGDDARVQWTATFTGTIRVLISQAGCATNTSFTTLVYRIYNTPPANDNCASATTLTPGLPGVACAPVTGNTLGATSSGVAACASGSTADDDVWYVFTAAATGLHTVQVTGSTNFDPVIEVFNAGACGASSMGCLDSTGQGGIEAYTFNAIAGNTYRIRVYDFYTGYPNTTTFDICITRPPTAPPVNDNCAGATVLVPSAVANWTAGTVANATGSGLATCGGTAEDDVFYKFVATTTEVTIYVRPSASMDPVIHIFSGTCGTSIGCVDATLAGQLEIVFFSGLTIGSTYTIRVYDYNATAPATKTFDIAVVSTAKTCATAKPITTLPYYESYASTFGSSTLTRPFTGSCGTNNNTGWLYQGAGHDLLYQYTPTSNECITVGISRADAPITVGVGVAAYAGCPGAAGTTCEGIFSNTQVYGGSYLGDFNASGTFCLRSGITYYFLITTNSALVNQTILDVSFTRIPESTNDLPCSATSLTVGNMVEGALCVPAAGAEEPGTPACWTGGGNLNTVWYKFVATSSSMTVNVDPLERGIILNFATNNAGLPFIPQTAVYTGVCGPGLAEVASSCARLSTNNCGGSTISAISNLTGLVVGNTYYVRVDGYANMRGAFRIYVRDNSFVTQLALQECQTKQRICRNITSVGDPGFFGSGTVCDMPAAGSGCLLNAERNAVWYEFVAQSSIPLNFDIIPNNPVVDYDWALYDMSTATCATIQSGAATPVRCNYSGISGNTGLSAAGVCTSCGGGDKPYASSLPLVAGRTYTLVISNWSGQNSGFSIKINSPNALDYSMPTSIVWTAGGNSSDWFNPDNWGGCGVPACNITANIFPGPKFQPFINKDGAIANTINIQPGASLTVDIGIAHQLCGDFNLMLGGTFTTNTGSTTLFRGSANQTITGNFNGINQFMDIISQKTAGTLALANDITLGGNFSNEDGNFSLGANNLYVAGDIRNSGVITAGTSTVHLNGTGTQNIYGAWIGTNAFYNLRINKSMGTTYQQNAVNVSNDFTIVTSTSEFDQNAYVLRVGRDFNQSGRFLHNNGTVVFFGTGAQSYTKNVGAFGDFYNVTMSNSGAGLNLNNDMLISGVLNFSDGVMHTGSNKVLVSNTASGGVTRTGLGHVDGLLRRNIVSAGTPTYLFPMGQSAKADYRRLDMKVNTLTGSGSEYVDCSWNGTACNNSGGASWPTIDGIELGGAGNAGKWYLEPSFSITGINYDMYLYTAGFTGLADNGFIAISRPNGSTTKTDWVGGGTIPTAGSAGRTVASGYALRKGITIFSEKTIGDGTPLPVTLMDISAKPAGNAIQISWVTAKEVNNAGFDLERSLDGVSFNKITWVKGNGTTSTTQNYGFLDANVTSNTRYYYRIRQVDFDGSFNYSNVVDATLISDQEKWYSLFPNPSNGQLSLTFSTPITGSVQVIVYNTIGQSVYKNNWQLNTKNNLSLNLSELAEGTYNLVVQFENQSFTERLIIKR